MTEIGSTGELEDDVDRLVQADPFLLVAMALPPLALFTRM